jgi:GTPase SAR1 family protein
MEHINVYITGPAEVGKSTCVNAFTGQYISQQATAEKLTFIINNNDNDSNNTSISESNIFRTSSKLLQNINGSEIHLYDTVGITSEFTKDVKSEESVVDIKNDKNADIICFMFDLNNFMQDFDINMFLITQSLKSRDDVFTICILNKCDSVIYSAEGSYMMNDGDGSKFNEIKNLISAHTSIKNIYPLCAKESLLFSAGSNGCFTTQYDKCKFTSENNVDNKLIQYGLTNFANIINMYIATFYNDIINKHVYNDIRLKSSLGQINKLIEHISRLRTDGINIHTDTTVNAIVEFLQKHMTKFLPKDIDFNQLASEQTKYQTLNDLLEEKTGVNFEFQSRLKDVINKSEVTYYETILKNTCDINAIEFLYNKKLLSKDNFNNIMTQYINELNCSDLITAIYKVTNKDAELLYLMLDNFLKKFTQYVIFFQNYTQNNNMFEYLRIKLCSVHKKHYDNYVNEMSFATFQNMKITYTNLVENILSHIEDNDIFSKKSTINLSKKYEPISSESDVSLNSFESHEDNIMQLHNINELHNTVEIDENTSYDMHNSHNMDNVNVSNNKHQEQIYSHSHSKKRNNKSKHQQSYGGVSHAYK